MSSLKKSSNKVFCGVAAGIAEYYHWDPLFVRIGFIALGLFYGLGVVLYLILCVTIPDYDIYEFYKNMNMNNTEKTQDVNYEDVTGQENINETSKTTEKTTQEKSNLHEKTDKEKDSGIKKQNRNSGNLFIALFIFLLGLGFLGRNLDFFYINWSRIWKYWPLILCGVGLNLLPISRKWKTIVLILFIVASIILILCMEAVFIGKINL